MLLVQEFGTGGGLAVGEADELTVAAVVGPSLFAVVASAVETPVVVVVEVNIGVAEDMGTEVPGLAAVLAVGMVAFAAVETPGVAVGVAVVVETVVGIEGCSVVSVDEMVDVIIAALTVEVVVVGPAAVIVVCVVSLSNVVSDLH